MTNSSFTNLKNNVVDFIDTNVKTPNQRRKENYLENIIKKLLLLKLLSKQKISIIDDKKKRRRQAMNAEENESGLDKKKMTDIEEGEAEPEVGAEIEKVEGNASAIKLKIMGKPETESESEAVAEAKSNLENDISFSPENGLTINLDAIVDSLLLDGFVPGTSTAAQKADEAGYSKQVEVLDKDLAKLNANCPGTLTIPTSAFDGGAFSLLNYINPAENTSCATQLKDSTSTIFKGLIAVVVLAAGSAMGNN